MKQVVHVGDSVSKCNSLSCCKTSPKIVAGNFRQLRLAVNGVGSV